MTEETKFAQQVGQLISDLRDRESNRARHAERLHAELKDRGLLPRVTLHRYMCKRGCQIATVFSADGRIFCAVRDYKLSPGLNLQESVPAARENNTLDGDRHWPGHVYDVGQLADFSASAGMDLVCRHTKVTLNASVALGAVRGVTPGQPKKPTLL